MPPGPGIQLKPGVPIMFTVAAVAMSVQKKMSSHNVPTISGPPPGGKKVSADRSHIPPSETAASEPEASETPESAAALSVLVLLSLATVLSVPGWESVPG